MHRLGIAAQHRMAAEDGEAVLLHAAQRLVVPQCSHSQRTAQGCSGPRPRIAPGTGTSVCRSNGQALLRPTCAAAAAWRCPAASRSWAASTRAPATLRLRRCGGGGATSRWKASSSTRSRSRCHGMMPDQAAACRKAATAAMGPETTSP